MKEILETKTELYDKIKSVVEFKATWETDPVSKKFKLIVEGIYMNRTKAKSGLTDGDKEWIANLVISAVKPIWEEIKKINERLERIENCPTIKKELK